MKKDIIDKYDELLYSVYIEQDLSSLEGNDFKYKDINILSCPVNPDYNEPKFQPTVNLWDMINCNKDLKYYCGQLYLLREYINNPFENILELENGKSLSTYYQSSYDRRYCSFITSCFEKSYNFWDRVGDRLASFYPGLLKIHQVDFSRIIVELQKQNIDNEHFMWLSRFKDNEYKALNNYRKYLVHYSQFESKFRYQHSMNATNTKALDELWNEKFSFPDYFKEVLKLSDEGYYRMVKFLESVVINRNEYAG